MYNLKYCFEGHVLEVEIEDQGPEEAYKIFYTLVRPNGKKESIDFTSYGLMTEEAFQAIVLLDNPKRPEMKNRCSFPWTNESIIEALNA